MGVGRVARRIFSIKEFRKDWKNMIDGDKIFCSECVIRKLEQDVASNFVVLRGVLILVIIITLIKIL